jgi:hypothetical protein
VKQLQETNLEILIYLKRFQYLTTSQLIKLKVASSRSAVNRILKRFFKNGSEEVKTPLVKKITFPITTRGKVENIYFLSKKGVDFLTDYLELEPNSIIFPRDNFFYKDYEHRVAQVNYHINLYLKSQKEEFSIDFFYNYFDRKPNRANIEFKDGSSYKPDGIYQVTKDLKGSKQSYLYTLEIHKGNDIKRALETIKKNVRALIDGSVSDKFNFEYSNQVIMVFDSEKISQSVRKRFLEDKELVEFENFIIFM